MPGVPLDALAQVKRGLRRLFSRRKKTEKQPPQPEPTPGSNAPIARTPAAAIAPVEAPTTSKSSVTEPEPAPNNEPPPATPTESPTSPTSHPHIPAPSQIEEAKGIDLNPTHTITTDEGIQPSATDGTTEPPDTTRPDRNETGMSATSGPMGDHMAEAWRDSDVGKEGRPVGLEGEGEGEGRF